MNVLGIDIGGTKIAARIVSSEWETLAEQVIATPAAARPESLLHYSDPQAARAAGRAALLDTLTDLCRKLDLTAHTVARVGVGTAGQVDTSSGTVIDANDNLLGWKGTPLAAILSESLGLPVYVDNDVRTMALAEYTLGAGQPYRHVLFLTVGTGIGGAIVMDGRLWRGAHFSAGEIGYLFGGIEQDQPHSIEQLYAGAALERRSYKGAHTLREIVAWAQQGDDPARAFVQQAAQDLGLRLAPAFAFLDPEAVIIGGGVAEIGPLWWEPFTAAVRGFGLASTAQMPLLHASMGSHAGVIGAALLAFREGQ